MASRDVSDAVEAYLAANFSACPVVAIGGRRAEPPPSRSAFVQVQYPVGFEEQRSIGAPGENWFREEGAIRFVVFSPAGESVTALASLADNLRDLFRNRRFDGVRTFEANPITLDDGSDQPGYLQGSFAVAYEYDITA